jgi:hypothetical protein
VVDDVCFGTDGVVEELAPGTYGVAVAEVEVSQGVVALSAGVEAVCLPVVEGPVEAEVELSPVGLGAWGVISLDGIIG